MKNVSTLEISGSKVPQTKSKDISQSDKRRTRNNRKRQRGKESRMLSHMSSVNYAARREGMWSASNDRSLLPTQSFLGAFDDSPDVSGLTTLTTRA